MEDIKKYSKKAEEHLEAMKAESLRMIQAKKWDLFPRNVGKSYIGNLVELLNLITKQ